MTVDQLIIKETSIHILMRQDRDKTRSRFSDETRKRPRLLVCLVSWPRWHLETGKYVIDSNLHQAAADNQWQEFVTVHVLIAGNILKFSFKSDICYLLKISTFVMVIFRFCSWIPMNMRVGIIISLYLWDWLLSKILFSMLQSRWLMSDVRTWRQTPREEVIKN